MNCKKCNSPLSEGTIFCPNCGEKVVTDVVTSETVVEPVDNVENNMTEAANTVSQTVPVERKRSKAPLIIGIIAGSLVLLGLIIFLVVGVVLPSLIYSNNPKKIPKPIVEPKKDETVVIDGYTFTVPDGFEITTDSYGQKMLGNDSFSAGIDFSSIKPITYEDVYASKDIMASQGNVPDGFIYKGYFEESYSGQKYLIFRYEDTSRNKDIYDKAVAKFSDNSVFMTQINYAKSERYNGYSLLTKFIKSAKTDDVTTTDNEDYMVVGDDTLGYLKLPGKWTKGSVAGASATAIQYVNNESYNGSTANGSYIVTLNVWNKTPDSTATAKTTSEAEANYYRTNDPDASNISVELVKLGKFDAYKLSCQYKSDKVWVITWYIDGDDGLVHIIQVEGLDLTNDFFKIPESFSFTKIN